MFMSSASGPESFSIAEASAMSDLIGRIYAEQITAENWGEVLQLLGRLISFKSVGAVRLSDRVPNEWIPILPDHEGADLRSEIEPDIIAVMERALERGLVVWRPIDLMSAEEWQKSPLRAYATKRGLDDIVHMSCRIGPGESAHVCLVREDIDDPFSDRDIFILRHLQHHLSIALRIRRVAAANEAAAETFRQVMRAGFICNSYGKIEEMNRFGRRIIEDTDKDPEALVKLIEETARRLIETGENWTHIDLLGDKGRLSVHSLKLQTKPPRYAVVVDSYEYFRRVLRHRMQDAGLTAREIEICLLLVQGMSNREVAEALFIAESTVKDHMTSMLEKFGVSSRNGIVPKLLGYDTR
jgi:DNA-binding CsgD family transcriptional regulator